MNRKSVTLALLFSATSLAPAGKLFGTDEALANAAWGLGGLAATSWICSNILEGGAMQKTLSQLGLSKGEAASMTGVMGLLLTLNAIGMEGCDAAACWVPVLTLAGKLFTGPALLKALKRLKFVGDLVTDEMIEARADRTEVEKGAEMLTLYACVLGYNQFLKELMRNAFNYPDCLLNLKKKIIEGIHDRVQGVRG